MKRTKINSLLNSKEVNFPVCVKGWVRSFRNNQFIALNDGSCLATLQVVVGLDLLDENTSKQLTNDRHTIFSMRPSCMTRTVIA